MKIFKCDQCDQVVYFENTECLRCHSGLAFAPDRMDMVSVREGDDGLELTAGAHLGYRRCANAAHEACNWLIAPSDASELCFACRHNRTVPDLSSEGAVEAWRTVEVAKKRLFYSILRLGLPSPTWASGDSEPLEFDFLADQPNGPKVMTGHDNGLITLSLNEADDAKREASRVRLGELYRTLLGHFRHEVGHYYWDKLVRDAGEDELARCRALFGDDREDYGQALERYYKNGPAEDWQSQCVSPYSTMHAWEDWAETWAHFLHIIDTLEMASAFGISIAPDEAADGEMQAEINVDPYRLPSMKTLLDAWLPLTHATNSLNRSMGHADMYPFVISEPVVQKLGYIRGLVAKHRSNASHPI